MRDETLHHSQGGAPSLPVLDSVITLCVVTGAGQEPHRLAAAVLDVSGLLDAVVCDGVPLRPGHGPLDHTEAEQERGESEPVTLGRPDLDWRLLGLT